MEWVISAMPDCSVVVVMARLGQIKQHSLNQLHECAVFSEKTTWSHWFSIAMFICTFFAIWIPIRFEILKTQFIWTLHTEIWFTYSFICALRVFLKKIKLLLKSVRFFFPIDQIISGLQHAFQSSPEFHSDWAQLDRPRCLH